MKKVAHKAIAIVGMGAVMPDAPGLQTFWNNIKTGKYSISDVPKDRWDADLYYDPDRKAPDKTYSRIGGWVKDFDWNPIKWRLPIPPKVAAQMDYTQIWAICAAREALMDFGYPDKEFDHDRTAVILGVAMGGDQHLYSAARIFFPEYAKILEDTSFGQLPATQRSKIIHEMKAGMDTFFPGITEDTMPGELSNIVAGRIAALYNFHGPNYIADAACASAMAGIQAAVEGLEEYDYDLVVTGGIDANMAPSTFVKFCKIGALSATGTRPYAEGADGFIMGEGAAVMILKRLEDAERDGDKIYAVIRSLGGSSDGRGKGITAPNPVGQIIAIKNAWNRIGLSPATAGMIEGHGTSTTVGDVVELNCLQEVFSEFDLKKGSVALGSVKSNIGHLKGAAGAAGLVKAAMSLHEKVLPPSINYHKPNPGFDIANSPLYVNTELRPWELNGNDVRRCGVSAFGFGGTNFHAILEEYIPGKLTNEERTQQAHFTIPEKKEKISLKTPLRGALVLGAGSEDALLNRLESLLPEVKKVYHSLPKLPALSDLRSNFRIAIDHGSAEELENKLKRAIKALNANNPTAWIALAAKGIFQGKGKPGKTAFLYTGQGSQYVNMLRELRDTEPIVAQTFAEADEIMKPLIGKPLTEHIFVDENDKDAVNEAGHQLKQTEITQPAVLTVDIALHRLMLAYGITPDFVIGHSLGEYGALVATGAITFADALKAVSARGSEMAKVEVNDKGIMAAVFTSPDNINKVLENVDGYAVIANINCYGQCVIGGTTDAVTAAMEACREAGYRVTQLPVSHAFHTSIVATASEPMANVLRTFDLKEPQIPIIANVNGDFYPSGPDVKPKIVDILARQVASPVQFVKGINNLYEKGATIFVEMGPKKALNGFIRDILSKKEGVSNLFTNHPKTGDVISFNQALCGLYAAGLGHGTEVEKKVVEVTETARVSPVPEQAPSLMTQPSSDQDRYVQLGKLFVDFMDKASTVYKGERPAVQEKDIWITGAALGLPGVEKVFQDTNVERLLNGEQFITSIPDHFQLGMLDKNIRRLIKTGKGGPRFQTLNKVEDVIKLAARKLDLDIARDFDYPLSRMEALDSSTQLAIGAGIDALRDAGIPLVMNYKTTTTGSKLPDRWLLPEHMQDDTGIIFASAFPGYNNYASEITGYYEDKILRNQLETLEDLASRLTASNGNDTILAQLENQIDELKNELEENPYSFNRLFLLRVLSMGHAQFAEYIGARGPNTQINSACASTTMALGLSKDWIQAGRCNRVIIIAGDDVTADDSIEWFESGFLAAGAAATDERIEDAALPFDKRRHGMIVGMGGVSIVVESAESSRERGLLPIAEVLGTVYANSAFHATRLNIEHIRGIMESLISDAERKWGIDRHEIAPQTVFVSHETYTPARGGSASAEVAALRSVFDRSADKIVVANTKGMTGHAMAVGIEDVLAVKSIETGLVPPVPNFREVDPELGLLNLSKGGHYPVKYALRLGAGFGSQIAMSLIRWVPSPDGKRRSPSQLGYGYRIADADKWKTWLARISGNVEAEVEVHKRTLRIKDPMSSVIATNNIKPELSASTEDKKPVPQIAKETQPIAAPVMQEDKPSEKVASVDPVQAAVMQLVAEKTGYPEDMLELDLDLEADLGIDTVKQAELFAEVRAKYGIERDDDLQLADFPTLTHIIGFVYDKRPDLSSSVLRTSADGGGTTEDNGDVQATIISLVAEQTGYPEDMLELDLDLEADLGIDTVKQAELFAEVRAKYGIERDDDLQLADFPTLTHIIGFVYDKRPDLSSSVLQTSADGGGTAEDKGGVQETVLSIVAKQTGYPEDMLELDLDLEADLGIDTVKQAELFAEVRAKYGIERDDDLQLADFPTLTHIIGFVYDKRPDLSSSVLQTSADGGGTAEELDEIPATVLSLVAEQTGYPEDMLELDLDLEADLGIDTVKQAELFAEVRGKYRIERDDNLELSEFPTLRHIIQFVRDRRPDLKGASSIDEGSTYVSTEAETSVDKKFDKESQEAIDSIPRRIPVARLRPDLHLCKATGVEFNSESRLIVMSDQGGIGKALVKELRKTGATVHVIDDHPNTEALQEQIVEWCGSGPIQGLYWVSALDVEADITSMSYEEWKSATHLRVKLLFATLRELALHQDLPAFLVSATRLGGKHGYDDKGAIAPLGGAVSGMSKAYKREYPQATVKVVDFEVSRKTAALAKVLIEETKFDNGAVEIGYQSNARWTISLDEQTLASSQKGMKLDADSTFLVTGAAGSIVSAIVFDLAKASGGTFHLLDLTPKPDVDDPDIKQFDNDKDGLKRTIFNRLKERGDKPTPANVEKVIATIERRHAALSAIQAVEQAGGKAYYHSVNLLDHKAVKEVMQEIMEKHERIDVLLHAGGLEISKLINDKPNSEFELVFDVKADGWFNMLNSLGDFPIGASVVFSSIAGRFGNAGQLDYSAANDFLCKSSSGFKSSRPDTKGFALDWTAWGGIGMASRGSIPTIMKQAGIDMLPPEAGIPFIRHELTSNPHAQEVVVALGLGMMMQEFDEHGGLSVEAEGLHMEAFVMVDRIKSMALYGGLTTSVRLDPSQQAFLYDHKINNVPVHPGVMGVEAMTESAKCLFVDYHLSEVRDVEFLAPFKYYRSEARDVDVDVQYEMKDGKIWAYCSLSGSRKLHGQDDLVRTDHFKATIVLSREEPEEHNLGKQNFKAGTNASVVTSEDIYKLYFHGPAYQVVNSAWKKGDRIIGRFVKDLPANHKPGDLSMLASPRLIELCFQTAGIWEMGKLSKMGLPAGLSELQIYKTGAVGRKDLYAVVETKDDTYDARIMDNSGNVYMALKGYRTVEFDSSINEDLARPLKEAMMD